MFKTAVAPLPAGTLLGLTASSTASEYSGETASTVIGFTVTDAVCPPEVPVTVIVYWVGAKPALLKVSDGNAGGVAEVGLILHGSGCTGAPDAVVTQESVTGLLNPTVVPRVMVAEELMPGSTEEGLGLDACK